jgi:L-threonylcarbamoyladenylate synthase
MLTEAARIICAGGIVAYPTEFCYGLGCDPRRHDTIRRLLRIKRRSRDQGLILIAARLSQVHNYIDLTATEALARARRDWPGPVTWLLPALPGITPWLRGCHQTLAIRITAHAGAAALCRYARTALVSTSANRHGRPPCRSAAAVRREMGNDLDYVLDGRLGGLARATEIRDAVTGAVVRTG